MWPEPSERFPGPLCSSEGYSSIFASETDDDDETRHQPRRDGGAPCGGQAASGLVAASGRPAGGEGSSARPWKESFLAVDLTSWTCRLPVVLAWCWQGSCYVLSLRLGKPGSTGWPYVVWDTAAICPLIAGITWVHISIAGASAYLTLPGAAFSLFLQCLDKGLGIFSGFLGFFAGSVAVAAAVILVGRGSRLALGVVWLAWFLLLFGTIAVYARFHSCVPKYLPHRVFIVFQLVLRLHEVFARTSWVGIWERFGDGAPPSLFALMLAFCVLYGELGQFLCFMQIGTAAHPCSFALSTGLISVFSDWVGRSRVLHIMLAALRGRKYRLDPACDFALRARWLASPVLLVFIPLQIGLHSAHAHISIGDLVGIMLYIACEVVSNGTTLLWQHGLHRWQRRGRLSLSELVLRLQRPYGHIILQLRCGGGGGQAALRMVESVEAREQEPSKSMEDDSEAEEEEEEATHAETDQIGSETLEEQTSRQSEDLSPLCGISPASWSGFFLVGGCTAYIHLILLGNFSPAKQWGC